MIVKLNKYIKMKKVNLIIAVIAAASFFSSCEKCDTDCNLIPAKIIRSDCDRVIFQLLTSDPIGDANWEDVQTGQRYSNVVSYYNNCKIGELTNGEKTTIYVRLKEPEINPAIGDCYRCQAISQSPPQTKVDFAEISKTSCENSSAK